MSEPFAELELIARDIDICREDLLMLSDKLPEDDQTLVALLEDCIEEMDAKAYVNIWMAAHWAGRSLPGRLWENGGQFFEDPIHCVATARKCTEEEPGETALALLKAADRQLTHDTLGQGFLTMAAWCWRESVGELKPPPEQLGLLARKRAREFTWKDPGIMASAQMLFGMLAYFLNDDELKKILADRYLGYDEDAAKYTIDSMAEKTGDLQEYLPKERPERILSGYQVRRAVEKIGRNEPCPCGSGKKYKRCCMAADQKKLSRSSHVAGKSLDDLAKEREQHLDFDTLNHMKLNEVMQLDPAKIPKEDAMMVFHRLVSYREYEQGLKIFEGSYEKDWEGWREPMEYLMFHAMDNEMYDLVLKIADKYKPLGEEDRPDLDYVRARGDAAKVLELLERDCKQALDYEVSPDEELRKRLIENDHDPDKDGAAPLWSILLFNLFHSGFPHLTIAFARAVLPILPRDGLNLYLERVESLRDKTGYPPLDVSEEIANLGDALEYKHQLESVEKRLEAQFSAKLQDRDTKLSNRVQEMMDLKRSLQESHRRADEAERKATEKEEEVARLKKDSPGAEQQIATNEAEIEELRQQMRRLKTEAKRTHNQRNELRRELRDARKAEEDSGGSDRKQRDAEARADATEETMLEPESETFDAEAKGFLTPRIPVFPPGFLEKGESFPNHVIPAALNLTGRLAAGDASAFAGVRQLKATRQLLRARFSGSFRLIFRVKDGEIEIVDVINRKDLSRWVKKNG